MALDGRTRVFARHVLDPESDYHEWVTLGGVTYRDSLGRAVHGYSGWQEWICNNPDCPARAIVRVDKIEAVVSSWLPAVEETQR